MENEASEALKKHLSKREKYTREQMLKFADKIHRMYKRTEVNGHILYRMDTNLAPGMLLESLDKILSRLESYEGGLD